MNYLDMLASLGVSGAHPGGLEATKRLLGQQRLKPQTRILEAGCGTGETACYLAAQGYRVTALDRHPQMLSKARERGARTGVRVDWVEGDITAMPFPEESFDVVFAESVTLFAPILKTLHEYRRVLKPGGILLDREIAFKGAMRPGLQKKVASFLGVGRLLTGREWRVMFRKAGFSLVQQTETAPLFGTEDGAGTIQDVDMSRLLDPDVMNGIITYHELIVANRNRFIACTFQARKAADRTEA